jgi:hypothetical protein
MNEKEREEWRTYRIHEKYKISISKSEGND